MFLKLASQLNFLIFIYYRRKTLREREEHRLWNGTEYVNLPDTNEEQNRHMQRLRWKELDDVAHPRPNLEGVSQQKERQPADNIPCPPVVGVPQDTAENYLQSTKQRQVNFILPTKKSPVVFLVFAKESGKLELNSSSDDFLSSFLFRLGTCYSDGALESICC